MTQIDAARAGICTPEMKAVAAKEAADKPGKADGTLKRGGTAVRISPVLTPNDDRGGMRRVHPWQMDR